MNEPKTYLLCPNKNMGRSGFSVVEITRIGQRYVETSPTILDGIYEPQFLYAARKLTWHRSAAAATRSARAYQRKVEKEPWNMLDHPTYISSCGGPGFYPLDQNGGPLMSVVGDPKDVDRSPLPPIRWNTSKKNA